MSLTCPPPPRARRPLAQLIVVLFVSGYGAVAAEEHPLASPDNFELHPALELSLFAREPEVVDPVALAFDEFGRAYVVEMRDYPYGFGPDRRPGGTVRRLTDTDGDGRADESVLFAEHLSFPTSVCAWNGGILVAAPPEILYLKDTDGDGKADVREVVIAGFKLGVTDSNLNGLRFGLDNWIHGVNGGNGGDLISPRKNGEPLPLGDRDFRFRPSTGDLELTSHTGGGFGLVFDPWGHSFTPYNIDHIKQRVADVDRFTRVPGLPPIETTHSISDHGEMARIFPISTALTRPNHPEQAGHFSAAGGMGFLGDLEWPGELQGGVLVGDVVGNLVHRDVLVPDGSIFKATRAGAEATREFFASRDGSFRPVGLEPGPDGALYLLDMQRDVIEHPDYIPRKVLDKIDLRAGSDRGRIYRIAPKAWSRRRELPGKVSPPDRVGMLNSPNPWTRLTAQRLLLERPEAAPVADLRTLAQKGPTVPGRLHALRTLEGLDQLDDATLIIALRDPADGIRENAVKVARGRVARSGAWTDALVHALDDEEARVRFQAVLGLGGAPNEPAYAPSLSALLRRDVADRWIRRAVLSALSTEQWHVLSSLLNDREFAQGTDPFRLAAVEELAALVGARAHLDQGVALNAAVLRAADPALPQAWQAAVYRGLGEGLGRCPSPPAPSQAKDALTRVLAQSPAPEGLTTAWRLAKKLGMPETPVQRAALEAAAADARNAGLSPEKRVTAVAMLDLGDILDTAPTLFALLEGTQPSSVQTASFNVLREHNEPPIALGLIAAWPALAPVLRPAVVNLLVYRHRFHPALLDALESGTLQAGELNLDLEHRRELLREADPAIRERAARLMSDEEYSNRSKLVEEWLPRLPPTGDVARGRLVFERLCAQCHHARDLGFHVGPELGDMGHRSVEDLASNILDPNMAINPAYVAFTAELTDGESETGILAAEIPDNVTLVQAGERRVQIPRSKLRQLKSGGRSLMPEGLEAGMTPADLRDVIAYLQEPSTLPDRPGPRP